MTGTPGRLRSGTSGRDEGSGISSSSPWEPADPFFPFGSLVAAVRGAAGGALLFEVYSSAYPVESWPLAVFEDLPGATPEAFGPLGRVWIGNRVGLKPYQRADLDAETQGQLSRALEALRHDAVTAFRYRAAETGWRDSKRQSSRSPLASLRQDS